MYSLKLQTLTSPEVGDVVGWELVDFWAGFLGKIYKENLGY